MTGTSRSLFGTDGIRGLANQHPMTADVAMALGRALTIELKRFHKNPRIIIGKDTRRSGYMLEYALTAGITSMGGKAYLLGPLPTPAVAYHIRGLRAQAGVMISASHNPFEDNGLKVFQEDGFKLSDEAEARLEAIMFDPDEIESQRPSPEQLGRAERVDDAMGRYLASLKTIFRHDFDLNGLKIVFDGANGAAYECGRRLFEELGAEVIRQACEPDGFNINKNCAQEDPKIMGDLVRKHSADIGIAVDGDADRLMVVDETGELISGEHLLFELGMFLKKANRLATNLVVTTSMSNQALEKALKSNSIDCLQTQVGDRYVTQALKEKGAVLGGENSGHIIFLDQNTCADGLFSALEVLALLRTRSWKASRLRKSFERFPQRLVSLPVREKRPLEDVPILNQAIRDLEIRYEGTGRVNVRYSGTQAMIRVMLEGPNLAEVESDLSSLIKIVQKELGS